MTGITALPATGHSFPITTYIPQSNIQQQGGNKNTSIQSSYSVQAMPGGAFTTIFAPGTSVQLGQTLAQGQQQGSTVQVCNWHKFVPLFCWEIIRYYLLYQFQFPLRYFGQEKLQYTFCRWSKWDSPRQQIKHSFQWELANLDAIVNSLQCVTVFSSLKMGT